MKVLYKNLPESPGVYIMKDRRGEILYIGKAVNLRRRVSSYFTRPLDGRMSRMVSRIRRVAHKKTGSALEALVLEAELIKKHQPPFNILEKDDKSFLYVIITKDAFPRILLLRGKEASEKKIEARNVFGPFVSAHALKEALRIIRKIFPWSTHEPGKTEKRPCFDYQLGLCPGTCIGVADAKEYGKNIRNLALFLSGKTDRVAKNLEREMKRAVKELEFEKAGKIKRQLFALRHINDVAVISEDNSKLKIQNSKLKHKRVEGYDISNISGKNATGSMVVFARKGFGADGEWVPDGGEYRKFSIRDKDIPDDTGMLREMIERRFNHPEWTFPDLILVDGGAGQVNAVKSAMKKTGVRIPVVGMIKGRERKRTDIVGAVPGWISHDVLVRVRDEAHRFALSYHRRARGVTFISDGRI